MKTVTVDAIRDFREEVNGELVEVTGNGNTWLQIEQKILTDKEREKENSYGSKTIISLMSRLDADCESQFVIHGTGWQTLQLISEAFAKASKETKKIETAIEALQNV